MTSGQIILQQVNVQSDDNSPSRRPAHPVTMLKLSLIPGCLLLGTGLRVCGPRCGMCGKIMELPDPEGQAFVQALPIFELNPTARGASSWLLVGPRALIARVSSQLAASLAASVAFLGERVLVAMGNNRRPILFCSPCGKGVLSRVNPRSAKYYCWDWLVEFEPRSPILQKLTRLRRRLMPRTA